MITSKVLQQKLKIILVENCSINLKNKNHGKINRKCLIRFYRLSHSQLVTVKTPNFLHIKLFLGTLNKETAGFQLTFIHPSK